MRRRNHVSCCRFRVSFGKAHRVHYTENIEPSFELRTHQTYVRIRSVSRRQQTDGARRLFRVVHTFDAKILHWNCSFTVGSCGPLRYRTIEDPTHSGLLIPLGVGIRNGIGKHKLWRRFPTSVETSSFRPGRDYGGRDDPCSLTSVYLRAGENQSIESWNSAKKSGDETKARNQSISENVCTQKWKNQEHAFGTLAEEG